MGSNKETLKKKNGAQCVVAACSRNLQKLIGKTAEFQTQERGNVG